MRQKIIFQNTKSLKVNFVFVWTLKAMFHPCGFWPSNWLKRFQFSQYLIINGLLSPDPKRDSIVKIENNSRFNGIF